MSRNNHENETYRPRSPDLSAFAPPPLPHLKRLPSYHESSGLPLGYPLNHRGSYDASPFFSPSTTTPTSSYFGKQPHVPPQQISSPNSYQSYSQTRFGSAFSLTQSSPEQRDSLLQPYPYDDMARPKRQNAYKSYAEEDDASDSIDSTSLAPARPSKKRKSTDPDVEPKQEPDASLPTGSAQGIEVKTKFPVARIKRIMQADEDVGKVAQATPTAVSKALELFIISLVTKGAAEARSKNSKKVSASCLKAALMKEPQMDFLKDICEKVLDEPKSKGRGGKSERGGSSDEGATGKGKGKKKSEVKSERMAVDDSD
jgi:Dr1-associated corepressor